MPLVLFFFIGMLYLYPLSAINSAPRFVLKTLPEIILFPGVTILSTAAFLPFAESLTRFNITISPSIHFLLFSIGIYKSSPPKSGFANTQLLVCEITFAGINPQAFGEINLSFFVKISFASPISSSTASLNFLMSSKLSSLYTVFIGTAQTCELI